MQNFYMNKGICRNILMNINRQRTEHLPQTQIFQSLYIFNIIFQTSYSSRYRQYEISKLHHQVAKIKESEISEIDISTEETFDQKKGRDRPKDGYGNMKIKRYYRKMSDETKYI